MVKRRCLCTSFTEVSLVVFVTILSSVIAQSETLEPQVKKVDQAVPQAPALTLLGISEEKLLRPATMQELIASIESKDGFAVELSPLRLMRGKHLTLDEYSKNPFLYQTRFSVGLERGTNNAVTKMGFGLRFTIVDRSDLRLDSSYLSKTNELLTALSETIDAQTGPTGEISSSASKEEKELIDSLKQLTSIYSKKLWNAKTLQFALASGYQSRDSTGRAPSVFKYGTWLSAGLPIHSIGQILFGISGETEKHFEKNAWVGKATLSSRIYVGTNDYKFYLDGNNSLSEGHSPIWLLNMGGEFALTKDLWFEGNIGLEHGGKVQKTRLVTSYDVKYSFDVSGKN